MRRRELPGQVAQPHKAEVISAGITLAFLLEWPPKGTTKKSRGTQNVFEVHAHLIITLEWLIDCNFYRYLIVM